MGLKKGMNDIYISGVFVNDVKVALFRYDIVYDEFSSELPQLLAYDCRSGKLEVNQTFETSGHIKKDAEKILEQFAEIHYFKVSEEYKKSQKSILGKIFEKLKS
ncbi:hypothetical protein [Solibacillus isronensis]|uniref:hypothetical protein n=1 Tax=Solibacillus isronensis TaxID=412383 RepID=UPI0009A6B9E0|nr:hypothetical protein [Solibacillus isronensis]